MNKTTWILLASLVIVGAASINAAYFYLSAEAQIEKCNKCIDKNDKISYQRIDFDYYFTAQPDEFEKQLSDFAKFEKNKYQIKNDAIPISTMIYNIMPNGDIITRVYGGIAFEDPKDADKFFKDLDKIDFNLADAILYAKIYHLENTNHYINPQPDKILDLIEIGNITNIETPSEIFEAVIIVNQTS